MTILDYQDCTFNEWHRGTKILTKVVWGILIDYRRPIVGDNALQYYWLIVVYKQNQQGADLTITRRSYIHSELYAEVTRSQPGNNATRCDNYQRY